MSIDPAKYFGFLTVVENPRLGLIGGYLILNHLGRPAEFHCTTPVRANRAQEILYGATLDAFLYGEQIAQILIEKAKIKPVIVITNQSLVLSVQEFIEIPVVGISGDCHSENAIQVFDAENSVKYEKNSVIATIASIPGLTVARWSEQAVGRYRLAVPELTARPALETVDELKAVSQAIDFLEPFERIRLAIEEAQKAA